MLASADFRAACFTDERLRERFRILQADLEARPACPLTQACRSKAALKAAYRFLDHPHCSVDNLLPAFVAPAAQRACRADTVLVVQDTTSTNFSCLVGTSGLGYINDSQKAKGIHLHSSLLLDGDCRLLGLGHLQFWVRPDFRPDDYDARSLPIEEKESYKWLLGMRVSDQALQQAAKGAATRLPRVIHVMDREGDIHEVFAEVRCLKHQAVIRCAQDRRVEAEQPDQTEMSKPRVAARKSLGTIELAVPLKNGGYRTATVEVRSAYLTLSPNPKKRPGRKQQKLWLVQIEEVSTPPLGEKAALWWLWTTLTARTLKQVRRVLEIYKARWRAEEYHRALKTNCRVEKLRLGSALKLMKVIAMKAQVAVRVVQMRDEGKRDGGQGCEVCFSEGEWKLLWLHKHKRAWRQEDGKPKLAEVLLWLGRLGGHPGRKGDGMPGVEVLGRGLYELELLLEGYRLAKSEPPGSAADVPPPNPTSHQQPRG